MKKILILLSIFLFSLGAETIKPKKVKARDGDRGHRSSRHNSEKDVLFSTIEPSFHASSQISFDISLEISTQATSEISTEQETRVKRRSHALNFINSNREKINIDMARGRGEHLSTLLKILELKDSKKSLMAIQWSSKKLNTLDNQGLLDGLVELQKG